MLGCISVRTFFFVGWGASAGASAFFSAAGAGAAALGASALFAAAGAGAAGLCGAIRLA